MSEWLDDQIARRAQSDEAAFQGALRDLDGAVTGGARPLRAGEDELLRAAALEILGEFRLEPGAARAASGAEEPDEEALLDALFRPSGLLRRPVMLNGDWWRDLRAPLLTRTLGGDPVAIRPRGLLGAGYRDPETGRYLRLNKKTAARLGREAWCFYRPLPARSLRARDLIGFVLTAPRPRDYVALLAASLIATAVGAVIPYANQVAFGAVIPAGDPGNIAPLSALLLGVTLSAALIGIVKTLCGERIAQCAETDAQSAAMGRLLSLDVSFFRDYSAGELSNRARQFGEAARLISRGLITSAVSCLFSFCYIFELLFLTPEMAAPAALTLAAILLVTLIWTFLRQGLTLRARLLDSRLSGFVFALFGGMQKIRLCGGEKRAFAQWAKRYRPLAKALYGQPAGYLLQAALTTGLSVLGLSLLYGRALSAGLSPAQYMVFASAYGMALSATNAFSEAAAQAVSLIPALKLAAPILEAVPESGVGRAGVARLAGDIELSHLSFRYQKDGPMILNDLNLRVKAGQYAAIVGKTGCGKSTLLRLILGFEKPESGAVLIDGRDLAQLDLHSLRRRIGTVLQNGSLFAGSIYDNIAVSAPGLSLDGAWEAARTAGLEEDIRAMPMGMFTVISEGGGGVSGGQKQRLLIARAVASKPRVLLFDEATSALDNITQKFVADSLAALRCTRLVIAHRLSTVKDCDRIFVMDGGRIVEEGDYKGLEKKGGLFSELVRRQKIEDA